MSTSKPAPAAAKRFAKKTPPTDMGRSAAERITARIADPAHLFNASLDGNTRRAIDFAEGGKLDEEALKALVRAAVALNRASLASKAKHAAPLKPAD